MSHSYGCIDSKVLWSYKTAGVTLPLASFLVFFFTFLYRIQCTVSNLNNDVTDDFPETSIGYYGSENISTVITFEKLLNFLLSEVYWKHFGLNSIIIYCNHKLFVST